jgi:uncharacterized membrane protein YbhN (UPF0104 family)
MTERPKHPGLSKLVNGALVALAFALLAFVIWRNRTDINRVFSRPLDYRLFAAGLFIYLFSVLLTFARWYTLVRVIEPDFKLSSTVVLGAIGMVFNLVIPGGVGGDLIKASYLVRMRIRRTQAIASMVIDRILGLLGLFILAAVSGAIAWPSSPRNVRILAALAWLAVLVGVLVLVAIFTGAFSRMFPRASSSGSKFGLIVSELREMSNTYRGRLKVVFGCLALSVLIHSLNVLAFFSVGCMLYPDMPTTLAQHFSMVPLILFTLAVPLPFGALGVTELVGGQLLKLVGHPDGELAMLGFRTLMYGVGLICACVYFAKLKEVRELTSAAHDLEKEEEERPADKPPAAPAR